MPFSLTFILTFKRAIFLGMFLALSIDLSIRLSGYSLASSSSFRSPSLRSLFSGLVHIVTILRLRENGIAVVVDFGWQLDGSRYWFLSETFFV